MVDGSKGLSEGKGVEKGREGRKGSLQGVGVRELGRGYGAGIGPPL